MGALGLCSENPRCNRYIKERAVTGNKKNALVSLVQAPVLWGSAASFLFYYAISTGTIKHPLLYRYFASHPVEYIATTMFFVGLAALIFKFFQLLWQPNVSGEDILGPFVMEEVNVANCNHLIECISKKPAQIRQSALADRILRGIQYVSRRKTCEGLESHLRLLAEQAEERSSSTYSTVRIIISTIPILGFLGTVIGITRAVAELASLVGDISFETAINSVVSGLSVAFDTTALALALSILLMFGMFFINRWETSRLSQIEDRAETALIGRFFVEVENEDPHVIALRSISNEILQSTSTLVDRQADIWRQTIDEAEEKWRGTATTTEKQLETALSRALQASAQAHRDQLTAAEEQSRQERERIADTLRETARAGAVQQQEMTRQTQLMLNVVKATEQIVKLEDALNQNLSALHTSRDFDQTIHSLTAAISLLNSRISHVKSPAVPVRLTSEQTGEDAA